MDKVRDRQLTENIITVLEDKNGYDIIAYDVKQLTTFTNYILIVSFNSQAQLDSVAREIKGGIKSNSYHIEGDGESGWILIDFGEVIVNIFLEDVRRFYGLERLWGKAEKIEVKNV